MKRNLIITPNIEFWDFSKPILFLGSWYKGVGNENVLKNIDYITYENVNFGETFLETNKNLLLYYNELLIDLVVNLNKIHHVDYSKRYWEIIVGPWLKKFISYSYHRYHNIKSVLKDYEIEGAVLAISNAELPIATFNLSNFIWNASNNIEWNYVFESKIIEFLNPDIIINKKNVEVRQYSFLIKKRKLRIIFDWVSEQINKILINQNNYFFYQSYFPSTINLKLHIRLKQFPKLWSNYTIPNHFACSNLRERFWFAANSDNNFYLLLRTLLPETIPSCYLEGYKDLVKMAGKTVWPLNPKLIFTSNAFDSDEIFKIWTAQKVEMGVKYYIGQHGNNYGTMLGNFNWLEQTTCDKFVTWGWQNDNKQLKAFNFKISNKKTQKTIPLNGIALIELHPLHRLGPYDDHVIFSNYLENQLSFVSHLPEKIRLELTVRLHSASKYFQWNEEKLWKINFNQIKVENGSINIDKIIYNSRLVVHSYDSTGILETLSLNIPTLCFWDNNFEHIEETAKPFYNLLKEAKIYFNSPELLANHVSFIWDNVADWWYSENTQNARLAFVSQFSKKSDNPSLELYNLMK